MDFFAPFTITFIAGLSTLIGFLFVFLKDNRGVVLKNSLSFSAGVMLCVSIIDLIPESLILLYNGNKTDAFIMNGFFILIGIIISFLLDKIIKEENNQTSKLYKVGIFSMLALTLHNIPEGIATFLSSASNLSLGILLAIAIALHNIPEGVSISIPIYKATKSIKRAFLSTFIAGMSEPLGAILAFLLLEPFVTKEAMGVLFALIAGIMIHISVFKLIPTALNYKNKKETMRFLIIGILIMYISHLLI